MITKVKLRKIHVHVQYLSLVLYILLLFKRCIGLVQPIKNSLTNNNGQNYENEYASYWDNLLLEEYRESAEELKERRRTWSRQKLEASGLSIFGASIEPDSEIFGDKIVRMSINRKISPSAIKLRDKFVNGDVLIMTPESNHGRDFGFVSTPRECLVVDVGGDWLTAAVGSTWPQGVWENRKRAVGTMLFRLDRMAPQAPLKAQRKVLEQLRKRNAGDAGSLMAGTMFGDTNTTLGESSQMPLHFDSCPDTLRTNIWNALDDAKGITSFEPNQSQLDAIAWALERRISLIRGPPGTGKTRCAALLGATALRMKMKKSYIANGDTIRSDDKEADDEISKKSPRILAVTHSNGAADVLLEGLLQMGVPAVRLGRPSSVSPNVRHRTIRAISEKIPDVVKLRQKCNDISIDSQSRIATEFELRQYMNDIQEMILKTAPVVVSSCIGAYQLLKNDESESNKQQFPIVVLDEAAQTTEPALICALTAARASQCVLIGDTRQLPPTITSMKLRNTLGVSPMARLEKVGLDQVTLGIQYRMTPELLEFPSKYFYNGLITCASSSVGKQSPRPDGFPWPTSQPLAFIQTGNNSEISHNFGGKSNPTEADLVVRIIANLLDAGDIKATKIAIITPYSKQVQLIRAELALKSRRKSTFNVQDVKVGTVDSFQGQETDLVIFSAVRSNDLTEMGFLRDSRRLNVAITRARRGLILLGDKNVLRTCRHWTALLDSLEKRGCVMHSNDAIEEIETLVPSSDSDTVTEIDTLGSSDELYYGLFST